MLRIDLNADAAEADDLLSANTETALFQFVSSVSLAAGVHAGNPSVLREALRRSRERGIAVGAHPGFADREGFGRREVSLDPIALEDLVLYQIAVVREIARTEGLALRHVKPHGALYNLAARDRSTARAIAKAAAAVDPALMIVGPPGSQILRSAADAGLRTAAEGFADRAYHADGSLVSRTVTGAIVHDVDAVVRRVIRMVIDRSVESVDGQAIPLAVETICIHGDTPGAVPLARAVRVGLENAGISVQPIG